MKISIFIGGGKYLTGGNDFSEAIRSHIKRNLLPFENLTEEQLEHIKTIKKICKKEAIEMYIGDHLTLDAEFAVKLHFLDSVSSYCLKPITPLGKFLKEIMIDYFALILTEREWRDTNELHLSFEVMDCGEEYYFMADFMGNLREDKPKNIFTK